MLPSLAVFYTYGCLFVSSRCGTLHPASSHLTISHSHGAFTEVNSWSWLPSYYMDCRLYLDLTSFPQVSFLFRIPSGIPCCICLSQLFSFFPSVSVLKLFLAFHDAFEECWSHSQEYHSFWVSLMLSLDYTEVMDVLEPEWGVLLVASYWGTHSQIL